MYDSEDSGRETRQQELNVLPSYISWSRNKKWIAIQTEKNSGFYLLNFLIKVKIGSVVYDWMSVIGAFKRRVDFSVNISSMFTITEIQLWTGKRDPFLCTCKQILPPGFLIPQSTSMVATWCVMPVSHKVCRNVSVLGCNVSGEFIL